MYKGMFLVGQLRTFFKDLQDAEYDSAIAMVHSRFSTNTNPSWERAHPNRFIVHNGEINTIQRQCGSDAGAGGNDAVHRGSRQMIWTKVLPVVNANGSDSAMLDNTLEFLVMSGMALPLAVMITIPEPWAHNDTNFSQEGRDFYQILCDDDGAVGRSCGHPVFGRRRYGRCSGQKRSASLPDIILQRMTD